MAYSKKTWKDRITEYPNRRELTHSDSSTELVTVARSEGTISQEGDAFSAQNMNDLEGRIDSEFSAVDQNLQDINDNLAQTPITVGGETLNTIDDKLNYLAENLFSYVTNVSNIQRGSITAPRDYAQMLLFTTSGTSSKSTMTATHNGTTYSVIQRQVGSNYVQAFIIPNVKMNDVITLSDNNFSMFYFE
jgi:archaellum component FlaC